MQRVVADEVLLTDDQVGNQQIISQRLDRTATVFGFLYGGSLCSLTEEENSSLEGCWRAISF